METFELEMRVVARTYVTTERVLKEFLRRAEKFVWGAPAHEREWVSERISRILAKFGFTRIEVDY